MNPPSGGRSAVVAASMFALILFLLCPFALSAQSAAASPPSASIVGTDRFVLRDAIRIHLWEKCLDGGAADSSARGRVAVLVHGATWSGRPDFDLQIRDYSLMDFLARKGYDVWAIDIHGYGQSDKTAADWSDTASAASDLAAAVEHLCRLRGVPKVRLLGWSWGTQIAGLYAAAHPDRVSRLILYGNVWKGPEEWREIPAQENQYRKNVEDDARSDFIPGQFEEDVVDAYARAALAADPKSPNGVLIDLATKLPLLDPERIRVPVMILRPEKDFASTMEEMTAFFSKLGSADKSFVSLPEGGHNMILERGHRRLQEVVLGFFERP